MNYCIKYGLISSVIVLLLIVPGQFIYHGHMSFCMFKVFTGIQCPLCGMTRACCDLLHLRFVSAVHYNPVCLLLPLLLIIEIVHDLFPDTFVVKVRWIMFLILLIGLGILFALRILAFFTA